MVPELEWLQRERIYEASKLEWESSERFWTVKQFDNIVTSEMNKKYVVPLICKIDNKIVGYNIYKIAEDSYNIINFVVKSEFRRQRIGSLLIQNLVTKLHEFSQKRFIKIRIRDSNEVGCDFLENTGFRFSKIVSRYFAVYSKFGCTNCKQDAYEYVYELYL